MITRVNSRIFTKSPLICFFFEFLAKIAIIGIRPTLRGYELFDITSCLEPPVLPHVFTFYFSFCIQCYLEGIPIFTEISFLDILTYIFDYYIKEMKWIFFRLRGVEDIDQK